MRPKREVKLSYYYNFSTMNITSTTTIHADIIIDYILYMYVGSGAGGVNGAAVALTEEQKVLVRQAIEAATTKDEIDTIERKLKVPYPNNPFLHDK